MTWYDSLTGKAFRDWLIAITAGAQVPQGQRLDPFATSMRVFKRAGAWLTAIEREGHPEARGGGNRQQNVTDLQAARLVERDGDKVALTSLGQTVLARWRDCGVASDNDDHELARCVTVVGLAVQLGVRTYMEMVEFWRELRKFADVDALLRSPHALYMASYLNQERDGYNPWTVVRTSAADFVNEVADWGAIKAAFEGNADVASSLEELQKRVEGLQTRATGRITFCRAMELVCQGGGDSSTTLDRWGVTGSAREAALSVLGTLALASADTAVLMDLLIRRKNVVLYGPPGTGKTRAALGLSSAWAIENGPDTVFRITFHPSYSYEDFIEGYRPTTTSAQSDPGNEADHQEHHDDPADDDRDSIDTTSSFSLQPGVLLAACRQAERFNGEAEGGDAKKVLLFIDEINRGDVARIFGELITYIEADKRGITFRLAQSPDTPRSIPENLFILGTMNTADKSISLLDIALRRRFAFVEYGPDHMVFASEPSWYKEIEGIDLGQLLLGLNARLMEAGVDTDRAIGHSLLSVRIDDGAPLERLHERVTHDIYPLICEYCFMDRSRIAQILGDLVDQNGRLRALGDNAFTGALRALANTGNKDVAERTTPEEVPQEANTEEPEER